MAVIHLSMVVVIKVPISCITFASYTVVLVTLTIVALLSVVVAVVSLAF